MATTRRKKLSTLSPGLVVDRDVNTKTAEEFMDALSPVRGFCNHAPRDWIFRGIGDADRYELVPSALRKLPGPVLKYTEKMPVAPRTHKQQVEAEFGLLWEFFRVADGQGLLIPEDSQIYRSPWASEVIYKKRKDAEAGSGPWPFDELLSLAALAQHYGVPTRLLDWSNDAFTAAYFAAAEGALRLERHNSGRCVVCGGKPGVSSTCSQCDSPLDGNPDSLRLAVWCLNWRYVLWRWPGDTPDHIDVLLVMAPRATNPNLHAQGGVFTVRLIAPGKPGAKIDREALDSFVERSAKDVGLPFPVMRRVTLPIRAAGRLLQLLAAHNIHAASIYPGFDGVVKHLREWKLWDVLPPDRDLPIH